MEQNEQKTLDGWKDVVITADMPLMALIQMMNVLNQRLAQVEDIVKINYEGQMISLTELYAIQAEQEKARQEEELKKQQEQAEQKAE